MDVWRKSRSKKRKVSEHEEAHSSTSESCKRLPLQSSTDSEFSNTCSSDDESKWREISPHSKKARLSTSKLRYQDLKFLQIFYDEKATPFDEFVKEVKDGINKKLNPNCPDTSRVVSFSKAFLRNNIQFSIDLGKLRYLDKSQPDEMVAMKRMEQLEEIQEDVQRIRDSTGEAGKLDKSNLFYTCWNPALMNFVRQVNHLMKDEDFVLGKRKDASRGRGELTNVEKDERFFRNLWEFFAQIFFLTKGYLPRRDFFYRKTAIGSIPDFIYVLEKKISAERSADKTLFFVTEVKRTVKSLDAIDASLEEQVDSDVLGQVGSELLSEAKRSLFWPKSLGILLMETKLIFVFLKISEEHYMRIANDKEILGQVHGQGKISYSQPFDVLNANDRDKMADFLFWLGCVQEPYRYEYL